MVYKYNDPCNFKDRLGLSDCSVLMVDVMEALDEDYQWCLLDWVEQNPDICIARLKAMGKVNNAVNEDRS